MAPDSLGGKSAPAQAPTPQRWQKPAADRQTDNYAYSYAKIRFKLCPPFFLVTSCDPFLGLSDAEHSPDGDVHSACDGVDVRSGVKWIWDPLPSGWVRAHHWCWWRVDKVFSYEGPLAALRSVHQNRRKSDLEVWAPCISPLPRKSTKERTRVRRTEQKECVRWCVRACAGACVRALVRACVRWCVRACARTSAAREKERNNRRAAKQQLAAVAVAAAAAVAVAREREREREREKGFLSLPPVPSKRVEEGG